MITDAVMQMVVADFVLQKISDLNISEATKQWDPDVQRNYQEQWL